MTPVNAGTEGRRQRNTFQETRTPFLSGAVTVKSGVLTMGYRQEEAGLGGEKTHKGQRLSSSKDNWRRSKINPKIKPCAIIIQYRLQIDTRRKQWRHAPWCPRGEAHAMRILSTEPSSFSPFFGGWGGMGWEDTQGLTM